MRWGWAPRKAGSGLVQQCVPVPANRGLEPEGLCRLLCLSFPNPTCCCRPTNTKASQPMGGGAWLAPRRSRDWVVCRPPKCGFCLAPLTQLVCPHSRTGAGGGVTSDLTAAWPTGSPGKGGGEEGRERPVRGPDCNPAVLPWGTTWTCSSLSIRPQSLIPIGTVGPLQTIPAGPTPGIQNLEISRPAFPG